LALGKFDALHKGHQALAAAALQLGGTPVLLSFSGMASVLGWAPRKPLVAPCDRPRVLHLWAQQLAQQQLEQQEAQQRRKARRLQRSMPAAAAAAASSGPQAAVPGRQPAEQQQQQQLGLLEDSQDLDVVPVRQRYIPFAAVRSLSPEAFVGHIKDDFRAAGVVSGGNYRFGKSL
jgi:FAD synthase